MEKSFNGLPVRMVKLDGHNRNFKEFHELELKRAKLKLMTYESSVKMLMYHVS